MDAGRENMISGAAFYQGCSDKVCNKHTVLWKRIVKHPGLNLLSETEVLKLNHICTCNIFSASSFVPFVCSCLVKLLTGCS